MRGAPLATSPPRTWPTCWTAWASRRASIWSPLPGRVRPSRATSTGIRSRRWRVRWPPSNRLRPDQAASFGQPPRSEGNRDNREEKMTDLAVSYVHGAVDEPLLGQTIGQALDRAAAAWADRPALIARAQGIRWTWSELRDRADAFATGLLALGLRRGDRIGIWSLNRAEWALTQFAAARAGLI